MQMAVKIASTKCQNTNNKGTLNDQSLKPFGAWALVCVHYLIFVFCYLIIIPRRISNAVNLRKINRLAPAK